MIRNFFLRQRFNAAIFGAGFAILIANTSHSQQPLSTTNSQPIDSPRLKADTPDQQLFFCTTRVEAKSADGKQTSTGTGFIFDYKFEDKRPLPFKQPEILFIVTCRHVVNGFASATFSFVQSKDGKPNLGEKCEVTVSNLPDLVFYDPDPQIDVALIPLAPILGYINANGQTPFFRAFSKDLVPSKEAAENLNAIQPIVFVGYPNGMRDEKNLLPLARRGFTASPYVVDFNGLPLFLIDANVFPGSSGSPVMVLDQGMYASGNNLVGGSRAYFLGLVSLAYFRPVDGEIQFKPLPSQFVPVFKEQRFLNLGGVIKAKAILNTMAEFSKVHPPPDP